MSEFLFRQEVTQFQDDPRFGEKIFYQPIHLRVFVVALLLVAVCFSVFASVASIKQTELVRGHLDPRQGVTKVFSPAVGIVSEVLVVEGQAVHKGQLLARVLRSNFDATGHSASTYSLQQIDVQIAQLSRRKSLALESSTLVTKQLSAQMKTRQEELDAMRMQLHIGEKRRALSERSVQRQQQLLDLGQSARMQYEAALDSLYSVQQAMQSLQAQIKAAAGALQGLEYRFVQEPFTRDGQILELDNELAQLRAKRKELEIGKGFSLAAPADGIVSNLLSQLGAPVDPRVPFLTLLPVESELRALLYVPSSAIGNLKATQQILLAYDAFPARVFGYFPAQIERIPKAVLDPREHVFSIDVQESFYLVPANLDPSAVSKNTHLSLRSGMQFSAYVVTGRQSLLQRLLSPVQRLRSRV